MSQQAIFKRPKQNDYFASSRDWMQDHRLGIKPKGLLATMLSMPPCWVFYMSHLAKMVPDGKDALASAIRELIKFGYVLRLIKRNEKGQFVGYEYEVYDSSVFDNPLDDKILNKIIDHSITDEEIKEIYPKRENPHSDLPEADFPASANPQLEDKYCIERNMSDLSESESDNDSDSIKGILNIPETLVYRDRVGVDRCVKTDSVRDCIKYYSQSIIDQVLIKILTTKSKITDIFSFARSVAENLTRKESQHANNKRDKNQRAHFGRQNPPRRGCFINGVRVDG